MVSLSALNLPNDVCIWRHCIESNLRVLYYVRESAALQNSKLSSKFRCDFPSFLVCVSTLQQKWSEE